MKDREKDGLIIALGAEPEAMEDSEGYEDEEVNEDLEILADSILEAVSSKNPKKLASFLKEFTDMCNYE